MASREESIADGMTGSTSSLDQDPAALIHEIEHIKELVRLSSAPAQQGISSQIFRRSLQPQVPPTQVLKELDVLKRRLKRAISKQLQDSPPENSEDDDATNDDEAKEIQDERLREIASIRAQLERVKVEREEWMENAENRIDMLIAEKADLSEQLQETIRRLEAGDAKQAKLQEYLSKLKEGKDKALGDLKMAEDEAAEVRKQSQKYQELHAEATDSLKSLERAIRDAEADKASVQASLNEAVEKVNHLEKSLSQTSTSLGEAESKIQALEGTKSEIERNLDAKAREVAALREENQKALEDLQKKNLDEKAKELATLREENHNALEKLQKDFAQKQSGVMEKMKTLEADKSRLEDDLAALRSDLEESQKESKAAQASKQDEVASMEQKISQLSESLNMAQSQKDELNKSHEASALKLQEQHLKEMQKCEDDWKGKTARLESEAADVNRQLEQSTAQHKTMLLAIKARYEEKSERAKNEKDAQFQAEKKRHETEVTEAQSAKTHMERALAEEKNKTAALEARHAEQIRVMTQASDEAAAKSQREAVAQTQDAAKKDIEKLKSTHMAELDRVRQELTANAEEAQKNYITRNEEFEKYKLVQENNTKASNQAHDDELAALRSQRDAANKEIEELKSAHTAELDRVRQELTANVEKAQKNYTARNKEFEKYRSVQENNTKDLNQKHDDELAALRSQHAAARTAETEAKAAVDAAQNDIKAAKREKIAAEVQLRRQIQDLQEKHDKDMVVAKADVETEIQARLVEIEKAHRNASQKSEQDHAHAIKEILAEAESKHQDSLRARRNAESELATATELVKALRQEHKEKLAAMQEESDTAISDVKAAHTEEMARLKEDVESSKDEAVTGVKDKLMAAESQLAQLASDHDQKLSALVKAHEEKVSQTERELSDAKVHHTQEMEKLRVGCELAKNEAVGSVQVKLQATTSRLADLEENHEKDISHVRADMDMKLAEEQRTHAEALDNLREGAEMAKGRAVMSVQSKLQETQCRLAQLEKDHEAALARYSEQSDARVLELTQQHTAKLSELQAEQEKHVANAQEEMKANISRDMQVRIDAMEQQHHEELKAHDNDADVKLAQMKQAHEGELSQSRETVEALKAEVSAVTERAEMQAKQATDAVAQLEQAHSRELTNIQDEAETRIKALQQDHRQAMSEAARAAEEDKQQTIQTYDRALGQARRSSIISIEDLRHQHQEELAVLRADMTSDHSPAVRELQEIMQKQLLDMEAKLTEIEERKEWSQKNILSQRSTKVKWNIGNIWEEHRSVPEETWFDAEDATQASAEQESPRQFRNVEKARTMGRQMLDEILEEVENRQETKIEDGVRGGEAISNKAQGSYEQESASTTSASSTVQELDKQQKADLDQALADLHSQAAEDLTTLANKHRLETTHLRDSSNPNRRATRENLELLEALSKDRSSIRDAEFYVFDAGTYQDSDTPSFEAYLRHAQSELWELGKVISHNEAMFAEKIAQHIGGIKRAKDQLAREYKDKFDSLVQERKESEGRVYALHTAELQAPREELVSLHKGEDMPESEMKNLDNTSKSPELQAGEVILAQKGKVTNTRSRVLLSHVSEFRSLNTEYERRLEELSGNREDLDNDLSVEPAHFEQLANELDGILKQLELESSPKCSESWSRLSSPLSIRRVSAMDNLRLGSSSDETGDQAVSMRQLPSPPASQGRLDFFAARRPSTPTKAYGLSGMEDTSDSLHISSPDSTSAIVRVSGGITPLTPLSEGNASDSKNGPLPRRRVEWPLTLVRPDSSPSSSPRVPEPARHAVRNDSASRRRWSSNLVPRSPGRGG